MVSPTFTHTFFFPPFPHVYFRHFPHIFFPNFPHVFVPPFAYVTIYPTRVVSTLFSSCLPAQAPIGLLQGQGGVQPAAGGVGCGRPLRLLSVLRAGLRRQTALSTGGGLDFYTPKRCLGIVSLLGNLTDDAMA